MSLNVEKMVEELVSAQLRIFLIETDYLDPFHLDFRSGLGISFLTLVQTFAGREQGREHKALCALLMRSDAVSFSRLLDSITLVSHWTGTVL